jgi:acyl-CoA synthetase (AMP-forming)/AMP-acid ligase II
MLIVESIGPGLLRRWIGRSAARDPDKAFIIAAEDGRTLSYAQLRDATGRIASWLHRQGVGANDRIALLSNNSIEHLAAYFGVMAYGATICTVHVEMNRNQLDNILPALKPRFVLCEEGLGLDDLLQQVAAPCLPLGRWDENRGNSFFAAVNRCEPTRTDTAGARADDSAVILFTSGTSARPKGVVLSFRELLSNAGPTAAGFGMTAQDRIYDFRSFNWCSAQTLSALPPLERGATLILGRKFSRSHFFEHIHAHGATIATGNPTTIGMLLNKEAAASPDVPALRFVTSSSAPLAVDDWRRFEERFGIRIAQGYGCSEIGWIAAQSGEQRHIGTVGKPLSYHRLSIVSPDGDVLKPGEIGAVELGGFADNDYRYLADDGSVRVNERGRMKTGDLGFLDEDGFLHLTGRAKEIVIRGGVNISPVEIDFVLMQHPQVQDAATVGVPDKLYGEEVVAYVVLRPGATVNADDILRHCRTVLPSFKAPKQIILSAALPKTERGKLDRKALVELWISAHGA